MLFGKAMLPMDPGTFSLPKGGATLSTIPNTKRTNSFRHANMDINHMSNPKPINVQTHRERGEHHSKLSLANRKSKALSPVTTKP